MLRELIAWVLIPAAFMAGLWIGHRYYSMLYMLRNVRAVIVDFFR